MTTVSSSTSGKTSCLTREIIRKPPTIKSNINAGETLKEYITITNTGKSEDIDDLSAWYSSIAFSVTVPE